MRLDDARLRNDCKLHLTLHKAHQRGFLEGVDTWRRERVSVLRRFVCECRSLVQLQCLGSGKCDSIALQDLYLRVERDGVVVVVSIGIQSFATAFEAEHVIVLAPDSDAPHRLIDGRSAKSNDGGNSDDDDDSGENRPTMFAQDGPILEKAIVIRWQTRSRIWIVGVAVASAQR